MGNEPSVQKSIEYQRQREIRQDEWKLRKSEYQEELKRFNQYTFNFNQKVRDYIENELIDLILDTLNLPGGMIALHYLGTERLRLHYLSSSQSGEYIIITSPSDMSVNRFDNETVRPFLRNITSYSKLYLVFRNSETLSKVFNFWSKLSEVLPTRNDEYTMLLINIKDIKMKYIQKLKT